MKSKGVTTQMKALDEYFLMLSDVVAEHSSGFYNFCFIWTEEQGSEMANTTALQCYNMWLESTLFGSILLPSALYLSTILPTPTPTPQNVTC